MNLPGRWARWKIWTAAGVGLLVLADLVLFAFFLQVQREAPDEMRAQRDRLRSTAAQLSADVQRGERIRASLSQVGKQCDDFYARTFVDPQTTYSTVDADLAAIAAKAGVKTSGLRFKRTPIPDRKVAELDIDTSVDGEYSALIQFVSGIERSKNFYFLNQLQLAPGATSGVRLQIELHTYVRI